MNDGSEKSRKDLDHEFWKNAASGAAANPGGWLYSADQLHRAGMILRSTWQSDMDSLLGGIKSSSGEMAPDVSSASMMLLGLCLENLAKGIIVANNPTEAADPHPLSTKLVPTLKARHLSSQLLQTAGISLTPPEKKQIEKLRTFLLWAGRYPVATDTTMMSYTPKSAAPASWSSNDLAEIDTLIARVRNQLVQECTRTGQEREVLRLEQARAERSVVQSSLESDYEQEERGGVVVFIDPQALDEPGAHVVCVSCGKSFTLSGRYPGAVCGCGTLRNGVCQLLIDQIGRMDRHGITTGQRAPAAVEYREGTVRDGPRDHG